MATRTTYHSFAELGIPDGMLWGDPIFLAQDEHTRQYHVVDSNAFVSLCDGSWEKDAVMSLSYSGNIALIDPPTQTVAHIYECDKTPAAELLNFDQCVAHEIFSMMRKKK